MGLQFPLDAIFRVLMAVRPQGDNFSGIEELLLPGCVSFYLFLDAPLFKGVDEPAPGLDSLEKLQGALGQLPGKGLDIIGPIGGMGYSVEMAFLPEDEQLVPGQALPKFIVLVVKGIIGQVAYRIGSPQNGRHAFGGAAQQVHIVIVEGLVPSAGTGEDMAVPDQAIFPQKAVPQPTQCPDLGNLKE